jgi:hypothetical protein
MCNYSVHSICSFFSGKIKPTLFFFILGGSLIIYILNVAHIASLACVLLYLFKAGTNPARRFSAIHLWRCFYFMGYLG